MDPEPSERIVGRNTQQVVLFPILHWRVFDIDLSPAPQHSVE